jgi:hypothetical protein
MREHRERDRPTSDSRSFLLPATARYLSSAAITAAIALVRMHRPVIPRKVRLSHGATHVDRSHFVHAVELDETHADCSMRHQDSQAPFENTPPECHDRRSTRGRVHVGGCCSSRGFCAEFSRAAVHLTSACRRARNFRTTDGNASSSADAFAIRNARGGCSGFTHEQNPPHEHESGALSDCIRTHIRPAMKQRGAQRLDRGRGRRPDGGHKIWCRYRQTIIISCVRAQSPCYTCADSRE